MHQSFLLFAALLSTQVSAIPLNINLGAYSPALVVGDGEISFGGKQDVSNLMNALEGAAVSGAAQNGAAAAQPAAAQPAAAQPAAATASAQGQTQAQAAPAEQGQTQVTSLQGMGKEIAPRVVKMEKKRDITGFNAALNYAAGALKTSPEVQLGTGAEGAGVGILQKPGGAAPAAAAPKTAGTNAPAAKLARSIQQKKRDAPSPKMKTTVTTMFVRGGPVPAVAAAPEDHVAVARRSIHEKRVASSPSSGVDGVNLNMAEGQVAELTFVETRAVDDEEEAE